MKTRAARKREREEQLIQPPQSFTILPLDVWEIIVRWGGLQTYVMVTRTCRHLNELWKRAEIQKRLLRFFTVVIRDRKEIDSLLKQSRYFEYESENHGGDVTICLPRYMGHLYTINKKPHRDDDLPVCEERLVAIWGLHGVIHRDADLPAVIWKENGYTMWFQNGKVHRENDKPAIIASRQSTIWWVVNGKVHRDSGKPAIITRVLGMERKEWWIHGRFIKSELF